MQSPPATVLVRRAFRDDRIRTIGFAYVFAVYSWLQAAGYHHAYPTLADRLAFARTFAGNDAIRLFYGYPYDVSAAGGYSAWRVGGTLALAAAAFGVLASTRTLRGEEDAGRADIVLSGVVGRGLAFGSSMAAIATASIVLWLAEVAGFVVGGLPVAGSAYLALSTASVVAVYAGVGAVASQIAPSRRTAVTVAAAVAGLSWLTRVLSDTIGAAAWVRWTTPLGWAEEMRPFAGSRSWGLLLPAAATVALLLVAARMSLTRDVGVGLVPSRDTGSGSTRLLSSPAAHAVRSQRGVLAAWVLGVATFAVVLGAISTSVSAAGISPDMQRELAKFGTGSIVTPSGYLSFVFVVFVFALCLFACSQIGAARQEEADRHLDTLLAQPVSRDRWLAGRMVTGAVAIGGLSGLAGLLAWAGAASQGLPVSLPDLMEAGANCLPASLLVLGVTALVYSVFPRASSAIGYTLVTVMFVWYLVGSVLGLPGWLVGLTPFQHIGLVPAQSFRVVDAVVMASIGLAAAGVALVGFRRRDLLGD